MKKSFKFVLLITVCSFIAGTQTGCGGNEDTPASDIFYHDGHSYRIIKERRSWTEAASDAASKGGYLAEIGSEAEQEAIWNAISAANISATYTEVPDGGGIGYIWIGATDRSGEGGWIWNGANASGTFPLFWLGNGSGTAVGGAYNNWGGTSKGKLNEPDNYTDATYSPNGQNAAAIGLAGWPVGSSSALGSAGEWNDISENNKLYYVIEVDSEL